MTGCPYTWFKNLFEVSQTTSEEAKNLRVSVTRSNETTVDVALPAHSARWLIELIPTDVVAKIKSEGIPLEKIQEDLANRKLLTKQKIFNLTEPDRQIDVWLE